MKGDTAYWVQNIIGAPTNPKFAFLNSLVIIVGSGARENIVQFVLIVLYGQVRATIFRMQVAPHGAQTGSHTF